MRRGKKKESWQIQHRAVRQLLFCNSAWRRFRARCHRNAYQAEQRRRERKVFWKLRPVTSRAKRLKVERPPRVNRLKIVSFGVVQCLNYWNWIAHSSAAWLTWGRLPPWWSLKLRSWRFPARPCSSPALQTGARTWWTEGEKETRKRNRITVATREKY